MLGAWDDLWGVSENRGLESKITWFGGTRGMTAGERESRSDTWPGPLLASGDICKGGVKDVAVVRAATHASCGDAWVRWPLS